MQKSVKAVRGFSLVEDPKQGPKIVKAGEVVVVEEHIARELVANNKAVEVEGKKRGNDEK